MTFIDAALAVIIIIIFVLIIWAGLTQRKVNEVVSEMIQTLKGIDLSPKQKIEEVKTNLI